MKTLKKIYKSAMSAWIDCEDCSQLSTMLREMDLTWFNYRSAWGDKFAAELLQAGSFDAWRKTFDA